MNKGFSIKGVSVLAAAVALALVATPMVIGASNALATQDRTDIVAMPAAITPVEVMPMAAPAAAETCVRKVRVVYSGYGAASPSCVQAAR